MTYATDNDMLKSSLVDSIQYEMFYNDMEGFYDKTVSLRRMRVWTPVFAYVSHLQLLGQTDAIVSNLFIPNPRTLQLYLNYLHKTRQLRKKEKDAFMKIYPKIYHKILEYISYGKTETK